MRKIRCYLNQALTLNHRYQLDSKSNHHLLRVLRLESGQRIEVFNGDGFNYLCRLIVDAKQGSIEVEDQIPGIPASTLRIHLYQALAKGDAMDYALQKATELGVNAITPVLSQYSDVKLNPERLQKKQLHWQGVIESAAIQSERCDIPLLHPSIGFAQLPPSGLFLHPYVQQRFSTFSSSSAGLNLLIGPEGGFSEPEVEQLLGKSWTPLRLGPRILRLETATSAALTALQLRFGDLG